MEKTPLDRKITFFEGGFLHNFSAAFGGRKSRGGTLLIFGHRQEKTPPSCQIAKSEGFFSIMGGFYHPNSPDLPSSTSTL